MLILIHGAHIEEGRKKMHTYLSSLEKKRPDSEVFRMTSENFNIAELQELLSSKGLFDEKYIVILDQICANDEGKECVTRFAQEIADSSNAFLLLEGKLDAKTLKKLSKVAEKVEECSEGKKEKGVKKEYSPFPMTDALGRRDRKKLWVEFQKGVREGKSPEELHAVLFWQVKSLLAASREKTPQAAGMKPFPYKKSKQFAHNYSKEEMERLSRDLVTLYHDARRGVHDLDLAIEEWLLSI